MADKSSVTQPTSKKAAKAELKKLREQQKVDSKKRKKNKKAKGEGFFARIKQVFSMTRAHDPNIVWWMLLAALLDLRGGVRSGHAWCSIGSLPCWWPHPLRCLPP